VLARLQCSKSERDRPGLAGLRPHTLCSRTQGAFWATADLVRTNVYGKYSGSTKITTHLDHISHCKTALGKKMGESIDLSSIYDTHSPGLNLTEGLAQQRPLGIFSQKTALLLECQADGLWSNSKQ